MALLLVVIVIAGILIKEKVQRYNADKYADYAMRWHEQNVPKQNGESYMDWSARSNRAFDAHEKSKH